MSRDSRGSEKLFTPERMCDTCDVTKVAATLPGYASVARASEVLHLAPRSVRDVIYAGRLPSLRVGRLHYIKASDLDLERRRRQHLPLPRAIPGKSTRAPRPDVQHKTRVDPALRRQRAAERAEMVSRWIQRHPGAEPRVPAVVLGVTMPVSCEVCGREVRRGRIVELSPDDGRTVPSQLCVTCGRRALLAWADRRRQEAAAARQLSHSLGEPQAQPQAGASLVA